MATTRIKDITTAATTFSSDDFVAIDGATSGTRKMAKDDLITEVGTGLSGTYLEESNNLSDVDSLDTSKLNMEIPDVGTAPNEVPLNQFLGSCAYQDADALTISSASTDDLEISGDLTFTSTGKINSAVGIGDVPTTNRMLDVHGTSNLPSVRFGTTTGDLSLQFLVHDGTRADINAIDGFSATDLTFSTGGSERVRIDSSGRVGIGTTSPIGPLTVQVAADKNLVTSTQYSGASLEAVNDAYSANIPLAIYGSPIRLLSGNVEVNSGNIVMGSSYGIDFGATNTTTGVTVTGSTLDHYESGSWTPAVANGAITGTGLTYVGKYTRVGNIVQIILQVNATAHDINVASYVEFSGLPFNFSDKASGTVTGEDIDVTAQQGFANLNGTSVFLGACGNSSAIGLTTTLIARV